MDLSPVVAVPLVQAHGASHRFPQGQEHRTQYRFEGITLRPRAPWSRIRKCARKRAWLQAWLCYKHYGFVPLESDPGWTDSRSVVFYGVCGLLEEGFTASKVTSASKTPLESWRTSAIHMESSTLRDVMSLLPSSLSCTVSLGRNCCLNKHERQKWTKPRNGELRGKLTTVWTVWVPWLPRMLSEQKTLVPEAGRGHTHMYTHTYTHTHVHTRGAPASDEGRWGAVASWRACLHLSSV